MQPEPGKLIIPDAFAMDWDFVLCLRFSLAESYPRNNKSPSGPGPPGFNSVNSRVFNQLWGIVNEICREN